MPFRLMLALFFLVLAGCTSSEPQKASYAPHAVRPSPQAAPVAAAPTPQVANVTPAMPPVPELQNQPASGFPPSDKAGSPQADPAAAAAIPPGATNCSTVDGVTLCDAPTDSGVDDPSADAYSADEKLYTN